MSDALAWPPETHRSSPVAPFDDVAALRHLDQASTSDGQVVRSGVRWCRTARLVVDRIWVSGPGDPSDMPFHQITRFLAGDTTGGVDGAP